MKKKLIFISTFPPPIHGMAFVSKKIHAFLSKNYDIKKYDTGSVKPVGSLQYHMERLFKFSLFSIKIALSARTTKSDVYITCNDKLGIIYTTVYLLCARGCKGKIFLHHHSFRYIRRHSILLKFLIYVADPDTIHIFLANSMMKKFSELYNINNYEVLDNSAFVKGQISAAKNNDGEKLVIGLLGNLCREKGLYTFIELLVAASRAGLNIKGILAGPANDADTAYIRAVIKNYDIDLCYLGPLSQIEKPTFYQNIDVFIMPTVYRTEAQPIVIFEAQAHGCEVIATNIGLISDQITDASYCISQNRDFVTEALHLLEENSYLFTKRSHKEANILNYTKRHQLAVSQLYEIFNKN